MSTLLRIGSSILRDAPTGKLLRPPWWATPKQDGVVFYLPVKNITWHSPNYYPTPFPGSYGRSAVQSGLRDNFILVNWGGDVNKTYLSADIHWSGQGGTGNQITIAGTKLSAKVFNTSQFAGRTITKVRISCIDYNVLLGSGPPLLCVRASSSGNLATSFASLYGDDAFDLNSSGDHVFSTSITLSDYLITYVFFDNFAPSSSPSTYPVYATSSFKAALTKMLIG